MEINYNIDKIKSDFKDVIRISQNIREPRVDRCFADWEKNKASFIERLGGLIYQYPEKVSFELNDDQKMTKVSEFITELDTWYLPPDKKEHYQEIQDLILFIEDMKECFHSNIVSHPYKAISSDLGKPVIIIPKGAKLTKAFKFFITDKELLTELQMLASRYIQEDKVEGYLCFSVHPLDFLSLSENTHNWRSCHALDGEYRAGNISYMVDKSTMICYLKSEEDTYLPNFGSVKWNSKKWRMLLHFSDDKNLVVAGRQYPFKTNTGLEKAFDFIRTIFSPDANPHFNHWYGWVDLVEEVKTMQGFQVLYNPYMLVNGLLYKLQDIIKDGQFALNYNDVLYSHYYKPIYAYKTDTYGVGNITIGGPVPCFECGEDVSIIGEIFRCIDCEEEYGTEPVEGFSDCEICGSRVYEETHGSWINDTFICNDCLEQYVEECEVCGTYGLRDRMVEGKDGEYYCEWCAEEGGIYNGKRK